MQTGSRMKIACSVVALLAVADAAIMEGSCSGSDLGTGKREETWTCNLDGTAECGVTETACSCDGRLLEISGSATWGETGIIWGVGESWDCYSKCIGSQSSQENNFCSEAGPSDGDSSGKWPGIVNPLHCTALPHGPLFNSSFGIFL